jgi:predicted Zn-dependent protease
VRGLPSDTSRATALLSQGRLSQHQVAEAGSLLATAGALNPDQTVNLLRGQLAYKEGLAARATRTFLAVTRSEPQNLQAWLALAHTSAHAPKDFVLALRHISQLLPPVPRTHR